MTLTTQRPTPAPQQAATPAPRAAYRARYAESVLIRYLPGIYQQDPLLRRILLIFESVLMPLQRVVDNLPLYTEPEFAPEEFLPWLAHWVAISLDHDWPVERQRALITSAVEIYRWRGTRRGLKLHVAAYTGVEPLIQEYYDGFVLGRESALGWTTQVVAAPANAVLFVVTVAVPDPDRLDPRILRSIIEEDKPAHTTYYLHLVRCEDTQIHPALTYHGPHNGRRPRR